MIAVTQASGNLFDGMIVGGRLDVEVGRWRLDEPDQPRSSLGQSRKRAVSSLSACGLPVGTGVRSVEHEWFQI